MGIICAVFKSSGYSLSRIHVLKRSDKNLEIVVPVSLRYLIGMSFIGTAFLHPNYLFLFVLLSIGEKLANQIEKPILAAPKTSPASNLQTSFFLSPTCPEEVQRVISNLDAKKQYL